MLLMSLRAQKKPRTGVSKAITQKKTSFNEALTSGTVECGGVHLENAVYGHITR